MRVLAAMAAHHNLAPPSTRAERATIVQRQIPHDQRLFQFRFDFCHLPNMERFRGLIRLAKPVFCEFIVSVLMTASNISYLNVGIYTIPEASKLTGVSRERIRRWLRGYRSNLRRKNYAPLWKPQLPAIDNKAALGFLDLIEVKFVGAFLDKGVSWPMIHKVREKAGELYPEVSHPFCTKQFVTDGRQIFINVHSDTGDTSLLEIVSDQHVFAEITEPFLKQLDFREGSMLERWWPLGIDHHVVLDPRKNFGQPTMCEEGVATQVLAESVRANGSVEEVARWYEISPQSVREAIEYEQSLAA
jgi:uncharacterized protein (DUF433 family)